MLEYLLRYLRRLSANWAASCIVLGRPGRRKRRADSNSDSDSDSGYSDISSNEQHGHRLDDVVGVLIRLRFEIDKHVAADMFPYNPSALRRRLVHIEALYERA